MEVSWSGKEIRDLGQISVEPGQGCGCPAPFNGSISSFRLGLESLFSTLEMRKAFGNNTKVGAVSH